VADPEQMYTEVLQEEQGKGSPSAVAEARAKAARVRAEHGSPHPKEPRWWPGSQPRWEGGGDGAEAPAAEEAPAEEVVEEAPAAEETPAPPPEPVATPPAEPQDAPAAPAEVVQPAAAATAQQPAAVAVPAAAATMTETAPEARPAGVSPGTVAGNRLRPEDSVGTEPQFDAQRAVYERRKLIDEVVATGVPAVAAEPRRGGGFMLLLVYLLIVGAAIGFVIANQDELGGGTEAAAAEGGAEEGGGGGGPSISASGVQFDTDTLELPAEDASLTFTNEDTVEHNVAIYDEEGGEELFKGDVIPGGQETTYSIPALDKGEYYFQCDIHPAMNGTVTVG
jgi:plastocyanin